MEVGGDSAYTHHQISLDKRTIVLINMYNGFDVKNSFLFLPYTYYLLSPIRFEWITLCVPVSIWLLIYTERIIIIITINNNNNIRLKAYGYGGVI